MSLLVDDQLLEQRVHFCALFDLYSSLLTGKQRAACELFLQGDLSTGELGTELGMSRQGAYDLIRRSRDSLYEIERELGLLALKECHETLICMIMESRSDMPEALMKKIDDLLLRRGDFKDV